MPALDEADLHEADLCVLRGSCTGVFAAVRAARLGLRVALVERHNCFGGTATVGAVPVRHSLCDTQGRDPIIGGLTREVLAGRMLDADKVAFSAARVMVNRNQMGEAWPAPRPCNKTGPSKR